MYKQERADHRKKLKMKSRKYEAKADPPVLAAVLKKKHPLERYITDPKSCDYLVLKVAELGISFDTYSIADICGGKQHTIHNFFSGTVSNSNVITNDISAAASVNADFCFDAASETFVEQFSKAIDHFCNIFVSTRRHYLEKAAESHSN